jgi:hypothetical protein
MIGGLDLVRHPLRRDLTPNISCMALKDSIIAKNRNTYAKRQREQDKKQRADDKRAKREQKKDRDPAKPPEFTPRPD